MIPVTLVVASPAVAAYVVIADGDASRTVAEQEIQTYTLGEHPTHGDYPQVRSSSELPGLNAGFWIVVAGIFDSSSHADRLAASIRAGGLGAYVKQAQYIGPTHTVFGADLASMNVTFTDGVHTLPLDRVELVRCGESEPIARARTYGQGALTIAAAPGDPVCVRPVAPTPLTCTPTRIEPGITKALSIPCTSSASRPPSPPVLVLLDGPDPTAASEDWAMFSHEVSEHAEKAGLVVTHPRGTTARASADGWPYAMVDVGPWADEVGYLFLKPGADPLFVQHDLVDAVLRRADPYLGTAMDGGG